MPRRIQRKRTKGWRKPENAVIVDRTSQWGNPFKPFSQVQIPAWYLLGQSHAWDADSDICIVHCGDVEKCVNLYRLYILNKHHAMQVHPLGNPAWLEELRGKDLCCWCSLDKTCHADVLLELANRPKVVQ